MGFFSFGKKREEPRRVEEARPAEMGISEAADWVKKEFSKEIAEATKKLQGAQSELMRVFSEIGRTTELLEKAEFEPGDRTYARVNMAKSSLVNSIYNNIKRIPSSPAVTYQGALEFVKFTRVVLAEMERVPPKQGVLVSRYFNSQAALVTAAMKKAAESMAALNALMAGEAKILNVAEESARKVAAVEKKKADLSGKDSHAKALDGRISDTGKGKAGAQAELDRIIASGELAEMENLRKSIALARDEAERLVFAIGEELSALKRPIEKLGHAGSGDAVKKFVKSPVKVFMDGFDLGPLMAELSSAVKSGKLKLKDSEKSRVLKVTAEKLVEMRAGHAKLLKKAADMEKRLETGFSEVMESKRKAEAAVREAAGLLEKLRKEREECAEAAKKLSLEIEIEVNGLEGFISSGTGRKVKLKVT